MKPGDKIYSRLTCCFVSVGSDGQSCSSVQFTGQLVAPLRNKHERENQWHNPKLKTLKRPVNQQLTAESDSSNQFLLRRHKNLCVPHLILLICLNLFVISFVSLFCCSTNLGSFIHLDTYHPPTPCCRLGLKMGTFGAIYTNYITSKYTYKHFVLSKCLNWHFLLWFICE